MIKLKDSTNDSIRVLRQGTCPSLSGKSKITAQLGADSDDKIYIRITNNTGGGFFSNEWIAMKDIQAVLEEHPEGTPVTSFMLQPLFHGKSVNTPAFLMAALKAEGIIQPLEGKQRNFELGDVAGFMQKANQLQAGKAAPRKTAKKKAPAKAAAKSPSARKKPSR